MLLSSERSTATVKVGLGVPFVAVFLQKDGIFCLNELDSNRHPVFAVMKTQILRILFIVIYLAKAIQSRSSSHNLREPFNDQARRLLQQGYRLDASLLPPRPKVFQLFGKSMSIDSSGSRLVIGAADSVDSERFVGAAYVYERRGENDWELVQRLKPLKPDPSKSALSPSDVSVSISGSGSTILVGFPYRNVSDSSKGSCCGVAYMYRRLQGEWKVVEQFLPPEPFNGNQIQTGFGSVVNLDDKGKTALITAPGAKVFKKSSGAAFVFTEKTSGWEFTQRLRLEKPVQFAYFGLAASLDAAGTTAVVSAPYRYQNEYPKPNLGAVYVFQLDRGKWKETKRFDSPVTNQTSEGVDPGFGVTVSIDGPGKTIVIGDYFPGSVYTYIKNKQRWEFFDRIRIPKSDSFKDNLAGARSLSLSSQGSLLAVGAPTSCINCGGNGITFIYNRGKNRWKRSDQLKSPRTGRDGPESFGSAVTTDRTGSVVAVGQPDTFNGEKQQSGAVYIFSN